jgi:hypothetical protein
VNRAWIIFGIVVLGSIILVAGSVFYLSSHPQVPTPLEARECGSATQRDELPNARFMRMGGRRITAKVWREGSALTAYNVAQNRDLRGYERLQLADPEPRSAAERLSDVIVAEARTFVWEHWRNRKRAYLVLTLSSIDATSTSHVFVEPDGTGRWRVYWRAVRNRSEIDDSPTAYSMKWVIPAIGTKPEHHSLPDRNQSLSDTNWSSAMFAMR